MRIWAFALRSLIRQPGRTTLGVVGVAAVGALLFDMLLLSRGLTVSMRQLLDSAAFDVRVMGSDAMPLTGLRMRNLAATVAQVAALAEVEEVVPFRLGQASATDPGGHALSIVFAGADVGTRRPWTVVAGSDLGPAHGATPDLLVNRNLAEALKLTPGALALLQGSCSGELSALPPTRFRVAGIARFPFDDASQMTAATRLADFARACGDEGLDEADLLLVASRAGRGAAQAVRAIRAIRPDLHPFDNEGLVARFQQGGFSYFEQISAVLTTVTLFFGFLLVTVLLTVSVNQRFAELAAVRALGFSRRRVVLDVLCQSALLVGTGGLLALPLGTALSAWLDGILRAMPGIPAGVHFFVFQPRALGMHVALLAATALLASLYPMRLVARLPIAATLRDEVIS